MIISRSVLLRMRNISDRRGRENETHILRSEFFFFFFFSENRAVYEIMWKHMTQPDTAHVTM